MTREEVRKRLEVYLICAQCPEDKKCYDSYLHSTCEYNDCREETSLAEAIRTAIKALEQLTSYEQTINKLTEAISEQATILDKITDEISALIDWHDCPIEYDNGNDAWYCEACNQAIKIVDKYKARREETE